MICAPQLSLKPQLLDARTFWATSRAHKPTTVPTGDGYLNLIDRLRYVSLPMPNPSGLWLSGKVFQPWYLGTGVALPLCNDFEGPDRAILGRHNSLQSAKARISQKPHPTGTLYIQSALACEESSKETSFYATEVLRVIHFCNHHWRVSRGAEYEDLGESQFFGRHWHPGKKTILPIADPNHNTSKVQHSTNYKISHWSASW
jgi:hypothetical protein